MSNSGGCGGSVSVGSSCGNNSSGETCCGGGDMTNQDNLMERKLKLTPMEYRVTQERQTERPFSNKYNKHFEPGSYHCIVCQTELFRSETKFESKSGWPAFYNVVDAKLVKLTADLSHVGANLLLLVAKPDLARTEVSCANCNAHLGHLFKDGPKPTGLRYCINSSSLIFYPSDESNKSDVNSLHDSANKLASSVNGKDAVDSKSPTATTGATCMSSCGQEKICFFQSAAPAVSTPSNNGSSNGSISSKPTTTKSQKSHMVNSSSSGCLGSKSRWTTADANNADINSNSIVRRRISLFSSLTSRPILERISIPPKTFILRETSL